MKGYWHSPAAAAATPARFLGAIHESPWRGALEPAPECITPRACRVVQGAVPETLRGTIYRNGAGRLRVGNAQYAHWFDGDGYVVSVTFRGANHPPLFRARYVRTRRLELQDRWAESNRQVEKKEDPFLPYVAAALTLCLPISQHLIQPNISL